MHSGEGSSWANRIAGLASPGLAVWAVCLCCLTTGLMVRGEDTFVYAVQLSAVTQSSPPSITLNWKPDPWGAASYAVFRKSKSEASWGNRVDLPGWATSYTDANVTAGNAYEYAVEKQSIPGYRGYGYAYVGLEAPLTDKRGGIALVVASNVADALAPEIERLRLDLVGDGWSVVRHDVATNENPARVRALIQADFFADPTSFQAVFLLGRVPIFYSGNLNYDGHLARAMPADSYYGDMDGDWSARPDYLPSDVELMVGRVDLAGMPGVGARSPWPGEVELLRRYLDKNHRWRQGQLQVRRLALMGNRRGDESGEATAASGYRAFDLMVGPGNTIEANIQDTSPTDQRWSSLLGTGSYLWAYGCGGGEPTAISHLGTHGLYSHIWSTDVVDGNAQAVFVMLFGSWFANWDYQDDIMRAFLATPQTGLAACVSGRPHWFVHHMALGEPIGYSARLSMNNATLYQNHSNILARAIYLSLMGDPTLRQDPVSPASNLTAGSNPTDGSLSLTWAPAPHNPAGYHVYRSQSLEGPYNRLTGSAVNGTAFVDPSPPPGPCHYMVRAVRLENRFSGSYWNASQGTFISLTNSPVTPRFAIAARATRSGVALNWNAQPGAGYVVEGRPPAGGSVWSNLSGTLLAGDTNAFWLDTNAYAHPARFYRVVRPNPTAPGSSAIEGSLR